MPHKTKQIAELQRDAFEVIMVRGLTINIQLSVRILAYRNERGKLPFVSTCLISAGLFRGQLGQINLRGLDGKRDDPGVTLVRGPGHLTHEPGDASHFGGLFDAQSGLGRVGVSRGEFHPHSVGLGVD
jgi:hypothetical protein